MFPKISALIVALAVAAPAAAQTITPPAVPAELTVPAGFQPYLITRAEGTQNYVCLSASSGFVWTFFGPQATLFGDANEQIITHYLSPNPDEGGAARPTWQHSGDTSAIWAAVVAPSTDPAYVAPTAIPWLLLRIVGDDEGPTGGTTLSGTAYIQRINTAGGLAPAVGCKSAKDIGKKALVPYTTDYVFYR